MMPLIPSPGRPKTTLTPLSSNVSIKMSPPVFAMISSFPFRVAKVGRKRSGNSGSQRRMLIKMPSTSRSFWRPPTRSANCFKSRSVAGSILSGRGSPCLATADRVVPRREAESVGLGS